MLEAFSTVYADTLADPTLSTQIQTVKDALYRRSYVEAFATPQNLRAYVVRWSPSRALAYAHIFLKYTSIRRQLTSKARVLCIGGGAGAEIAALAHCGVRQVTAIDLGDWRPVTAPLAKHLGVSARIIHGDALSSSINWPEYNVVTCLFTTNELFAQSKAGGVKFFRDMAQCRSSTILVIIESAGSYSDIQVGTKTFPVYFLIHHTLSPHWDLVDSTESEWYRIPPEVHYALELQNMRYFLRVYRRK